MPTEDSSVYECENCGHRVRSVEHPGLCPECDHTLQNTAVPRE